MIVGSSFPSRVGLQGQGLLTSPFRVQKDAVISQMLCEFVWILGWDDGLYWLLVYLHLFPFLEQECLVRAVSKWLGLFTLQLWPGTEVTEFIRKFFLSVCLCLWISLPTCTSSFSPVGIPGLPSFNIPFVFHFISGLHPLAPPSLTCFCAVRGMAPKSDSIIWELLHM